MRHDFTALAIGACVEGLDPIVACPACGRPGLPERGSNGRVEVLHVADEREEEMTLRVRDLTPVASCQLDAARSASLLDDQQLARAAAWSHRISRVFHDPPALATWALAIRTEAVKRGVL